MNAGDRIRYCIFGLAFVDDSTLYMGITELNPDINKQEIYCSIFGSETFQTENTGNMPDIFTVEEFVYFSEAQEEVIFWIAYFQSLGICFLNIAMNPFDSSQLLHRGQKALIRD